MSCDPDPDPDAGAADDMAALVVADPAAAVLLVADPPAPALVGLDDPEELLLHALIAMLPATAAMINVCRYLKAAIASPDSAATLRLVCMFILH